MRYYGGYYGMYFDPTYLLVIIGAVLCIVAQLRVSSTFKKYSRVRSRSGMTGAQAAARILELSGIYDVRVEHIRGELTDHYDPSAKVLRLSDATYSSDSVAAIGVAAHECGHAVQHHKSYAPLKFRTALVPAANIGSKLGIPIILLGALLGMNQMFIQIGIWVFALAVLFQIVTLPVEFNASGRALTMLGSYGLMGDEETRGCRKVLSAAALTYVAAAASSILQLLRLIILFGNNNRRRD
ncbi:MAG: zinc metallopeptidase [Lachnospiraceae bacterium]|nr:zinc metallopeptidase [Lachnospiraceae bacterium]